MTRIAIRLFVATILMLIGIEVFAGPLHWKRVAYSCCGSNVCLKQRMHTRVVVEDQ
jgi:hypothetical protein